MYQKRIICPFFTQIYGCVFSSGLKSSYFLSFNDFKNVVKTILNVSFSNSMNVLETAFDFFPLITLHSKFKIQTELVLYISNPAH